MCPSLVSCLDLHAFVLGARDPGFRNRLDWEEVWGLAPGLCDVLRSSTLSLGGWMQTEICVVDHVATGLSAGPRGASTGILGLMSLGLSWPQKLGPDKFEMGPERHSYLQLLLQIDTCLSCASPLRGKTSHYQCLRCCYQRTSVASVFVGKPVWCICFPLGGLDRPFRRAWFLTHTDS